MVRVTDDLTRIAWLGRRIAFGWGPGELDRRVDAGLDATVAELVDPAGAGIEASADPWEGIDLRGGDMAERRALLRRLARRWLDHMRTTTRPTEEWMTWFWHDHFAVSGAAVKEPDLLVEHLRLLRTHALGNYRELLRAVTTDPAMLVFLDGARNTGRNPNENYGRELLELYSVGVGEFEEDDVRAASVALTGWTIDRKSRRAVFRARRHDDSPQVLLGVEGVRDVDAVVDAVTSHPACARFIAWKLATAVLGPVDDVDVERFASVFRDNHLEVGPLLGAIVDHGLENGSAAVVDQPVRWIVAASKAVGVGLDQHAVALLRAAGQVPGAPPNVGGFPPPISYLSTSAVASRFNAAVRLAERARDDGELFDAARRRDHRALARALDRPEGFGPATRDALAEIDGRSRSAARKRLGLALASPELAVI